MQFNTLTLERLQVIIETQFKPTAYLWNLLGEEIVLPNDEIDFTNIFSNQSIAPYVTPCRDGLPVYSEGGTVSRYKLPYIKMRDILTPCDIFNKNLLIDGVLKSQMVGASDDKQRLANGVLKILAQQALALQNRGEEQMMQFLLNGKIDTRSSFSNGELIDFKRDAGLLATSLAPLQYWDVATSSPLDGLQAAADALLDYSSTVLTDVVASPKVFNLFRKHQEIAAYRKEFRDLGMPNPLPQVMNGVKVIEVAGIRIHAYNEYYTSLDQNTKVLTKKPFLPLADSKKAIFIGRRTDGYPILKTWGKIKNLDAVETNQTTNKVYTNVYSSEGQKVILTEAAPLVVGDPNCAFSMQVIS